MPRLVAPRVLVATAICAGVLVGGMQASQPAAASTPTSPVIAADAYHRHVRSGLGRAERGGSYRISMSHGVKATVTRGAVQISRLAPGRSFRAWLPSARALDTSMRVSFTVPSAKAIRGGFYFGADLRLNAGRAYRATVHVRPGNVVVQLFRVGRGADVALSGRTLRARVVAGARWTLEARVTGSGRPTLAARAWRSGSATPGWQSTVTDRSAAALRGAGATGTWAYQSRRGGTAAFRQTAIMVRTIGRTTPGSFVKPSPAKPTPARPAPTPSDPPSTNPQPTDPQPTDPTPTPSDPAPTAPDRDTPGAAAPGTTNYPAPSDALFVSPQGSDANAGTLAAPLLSITKAVYRAKPGQTIVLRGGTYHENVVIPKERPNLVIQPYLREAVWFDGTTDVTGWRKSGSTWIHDDWTAQFDHSASFTTGTDDARFIGPQNPMAAWPDGAWLDDAQLRQVASAADVTAGTFFTDYAAKRLVVGSDPTGGGLRATDLPQAWKVLASGVTLQGFGVRRFATAIPKLGSVRMQGGDAVARNLVITESGTQGLSFGAANNLADHVTVTDNGMVGIHIGQADHTTVRNSVIARNNAQQFNTSPSAAGIKVGRSRDLVFDNNVFSDNAANGLWLDQSDVRFTIVNNAFSGNYIGSQIELADTGIVANNSFTGGIYGLYLRGTGNVKVFNNSFANTSKGSLWMWQDARRQANQADWQVDGDRRYAPGDAADPWLLRNIVVSDNSFDSTIGAWHIYVLDKATNIPADHMALTVTGNRFRARTSSANPTMVGWGANDNRTVTPYDDAASFAAAKNSSWRNRQVSTTFAASADGDIAVPLPADVATVTGLPAGARQIGPVR